MQRPDLVTKPMRASRRRRRQSREARYLAQELWSRLSEAGSAQEFAASWLDLQCKMIARAVQGVVVTGPPGKGPFVPVAHWPPGIADTSELATVAELAMEERRGVVRGFKGRRFEDDEATHALAYPLVVDDQICGVVALAVSRPPRADLRRVMRKLQWGSAWLEVLVRRKTFSSRDQLVAVLELTALCLEHDRFHAAATALVTELATSLACDRVSIGFRDGRHVRVEAFSHSADFAKKSNLLRAIGAAMDEALDQEEAVVVPALEGGEPQLTRAHEELARLHAAGAICTVPLSANGRLMGAITLERSADAPFDADAVALCRRVAALVGPVLEIKKNEDRWLGHKALVAGRTQLAHLIGPRHPGLKLGALLLVVACVFLIFAKGTYRVTADASLEGTVQRVVTAPMEGYVAEAHFRAGDLVQEGAVLAVLDDRELELERVKWQSQREQRLREYSKALAVHDRAQVRVLGAQVEQAEAQLALLDQQLGRTRLLAPFDGVVVSGDFSQSLGSPVGRGEVMFEVAPLDGYRIILDVDERDISQLRVGQRGELALAGAPGTALAFSVEKITPVSATQEGRNYFRVEAMLDETNALLRPGMEGVAKVSIDERKLAWIWTHKLIAWARLTLWSWWP